MKRIAKFLLVMFIICGIAFSISNFLPTKAEALLAHNGERLMGGGHSACDGIGGDCTY